MPPEFLALDSGADMSVYAAAKSNQILDPKTACMWWCKKPFVRGKKLQNRIGKNEKSKIIVQLSNSSDEMPSPIKHGGNLEPAKAQSVSVSAAPSDNILGDFLRSHSPNNKRKRGVDHMFEKGDDSESSEEDVSWKVTQTQFLALEKSNEIRAALRDSRLQTIVKDIDMSLNRPAALEDALKTNEHFAEFYGTLLQELQKQDPDTAEVDITDVF